MTRRTDRVDELIKQELSKIIEEFFDSQGTIVTVSYVKTTPDLRTAQVFVSIFPFQKSLEIFEKLKDEFSKFQFILSKKIKLKYTPKIELFLDESLEYGDKIENLIKNVKNDNIEH